MRENYVGDLTPDDGHTAAAPRRKSRDVTSEERAMRFLGGGDTALTSAIEVHWRRDKLVARNRDGSYEGRDQMGSGER